MWKFSVAEKGSGSGAAAEVAEGNKRQWLAEEVLQEDLL